MAISLYFTKKTPSSQNWHWSANWVSLTKPSHWCRLKIYSLINAMAMKYWKWKLTHHLFVWMKSSWNSCLRAFNFCCQGWRRLQSWSELEVWLPETFIRFSLRATLPPRILHPSLIHSLSRTQKDRFRFETREDKRSTRQHWCCKPFQKVLNQRHDDRAKKNITQTYTTS